MAPNIEDKPQRDAWIAFYTDSVCSEADGVYKLAYALSLNKTESKKLVRAVYEQIAGRLDQVYNLDSGELRKELVSAVWGEFQNSAGSPPVDDSPFAGFLAQLPTEARAVLVAREILGMSVEEMCEAIEVDETKGRKLLASARKCMTEWGGHS